MLESLKSLLTSGLMAVLSFLPSSPFAVLNELAANGQIVEWLGYVNWFVPVYTFVAILEVWLLGIAIYYVWQVVLRWLKAVE